MNASMKAPKGGATSHVNGQHYDGGEFMPDHGRYCGKGKNRVLKAHFDATAARALERGYMLRYSDTYERFELWKSVRFTDGTVADQLDLTARTLSTLAKIL